MQVAVLGPLLRTRHASARDWAEYQNDDYDITYNEVWPAPIAPDAVCLAVRLGQLTTSSCEQPGVQAGKQKANLSEINPIRIICLAQRTGARATTALPHVLSGRTRVACELC